jgi:diguanylate cyclase (GGDEF)-like protein/PAS domain S-box-containing protein
MELSDSGVTSMAVAARQFELLGRMAVVASAREIAALLVRWTQAQPGCRSATVAWGLDDASNLEFEPAAPIGQQDLALARSAAGKAVPMFSADGHRLAIALMPAHTAVLLLTVETRAAGQSFIDQNKSMLHLVGYHLDRALKLADLEISVERLERSQRLQHALFAISDLASSDRDMPEVLRGLHAIVGTLMYAENFFIVLHDAERDTMRFLYFVDVEDKEPDDPDLEIPMRSRQRSLTWYLIRDGKPLMGTTEQLRSQVSGSLVSLGPQSKDWLGVPMLRDGRAHGAVVVQSYQEGIRFTADDRALLEFVSNHILTALERKQGKEDLERRVRVRTAELQRAERLQKALFEIAELATVDVDETEFYRRVHAVVGALINAENFYIGLISADGGSLEFPYAVDASGGGYETRPLGRGASEYVLRHGERILRTEDTLALAERGEIDIVGPISAWWLGVPLQVGDEVIGLVAVQSYSDAVMYGLAELELLSFVASQIANSLTRRRSAETLQQAHAQLEQRVHERTTELARSNIALLQSEKFLTVLLENLSDGIVACDAQGTLTLFNSATRAFHGLPEEPLAPDQWSEHYDLYLADGHTPMPMEQIPLYRAFKGDVIRNVEIVIAPKDRPHRILVCNGQPLMSASGEKLGAVVAMHDITERKQAEQRLQQLAHFDPLTALPNRTLFYETLRNALAQATDQNCIVSVLFLDIDHFKNVNDTMGHACGDELLRQVGHRLVHSLRLRDTVGRLGGDEFAIILMSPDNPESGAIVANKLRDALRKPFDIGGREVTVTASIGITVFPTDSTDSEVLIKYADTAMYAAKEAGRDAFRFYTAAMNATVVRRLDLDNALRKALERDEFVLHYQPKIDLSNGRWTGVEALIRWNRPGHGMVPPADFIPLLEETGLIESVGIWVIQAACKQIAAWIEAGIGPVPIAVNVSVKQLLHGRLDAESTRAGDIAALVEAPALEPAIERALREHSIATNLLEIELTESALMLHAAKTVALLQRLKSLGVQISIDDFGTGYSSLAYLKRFPINTVKIDQTFVRDITTDPDDAAITLAIISLAHSLKLKVVAEGVETREQLDFLRTHGCDQAQGFLLARPMAADAVTALFAASRSWSGGIDSAND